LHQTQNSLLQPEKEPSFVDRYFDLTFRFSHSTISFLEADAKRLKKGKPPAYFKKKTNCTICFSFVSVSKCSVIASLGQNGS